ncbi:unnamed protein product [Prorocentrum cordatum]|uniref:Uncharacterized protein n=1 Tax=Prorocentrum cordatum TaxID=2364126 RepID=A0ABN9TDB7_9DINO|nr:unnamed protein product [Polarella glacialis]
MLQVRRNGEWLMGSISQIEHRRLRIQYQVPGKSGMAIKWMDADSSDVQRFAAAAAPPPREHPGGDAPFGQQPPDPWGGSRGAAPAGAPQPAAQGPAGGGARWPQKGSWTPWS